MIKGLVHSIQWIECKPHVANATPVKKQIGSPLCNNGKHPWAFLPVRQSLFYFTILAVFENSVPL